MSNALCCLPRLTLSRAGACSVTVSRIPSLRWQPAAAPALRRRVAAAAASAAATPAVTPLQGAAPKFSDLAQQQQQQVEAYLDILLDWNENKMNLTAVTDRGEAYERHVNDSLALLPALDRCLAAQQQRLLDPRASTQQAGSRDSLPGVSTSSSGSSSGTSTAAAQGPVRLIDVGSGAGLPGIILAIARPHWEVTLLDSLQKRCKFSEAAAEAAGLHNVRVHWARAEDAGQDAALREQYDAAVARAVAELRVLTELCLPLVRLGGHWVAAKGAAPLTEVAAAEGAVKKLGGELLGVEEVDSESPEGRRTAVVVLKKARTPAQYPRKPGVPGKKPL